MRTSVKINSLTKLLTTLNSITDVTTSIDLMTEFFISKLCFGIGHTNKKELLDGDLLTAVKFDNVKLPNSTLLYIFHQSGQ